MLVKVTRGGVKHNDVFYKEGQTLELPDEKARQIIFAGNVEEVKEVQPVAQEPKPVEKKAEEVKKEPVEQKAEVKPDVGWTIKEILEYGASKGIKSLEGKSKAKMISLIEKGVK